jgi:excisionase family DNA binding protein
MTTTQNPDVFQPSDDDIREATEAIRGLADVAENLQFVMKGVGKLRNVPLPQLAAPLMLRVLREIAAGHAVAVMPVEMEISPLTTTQAAEILDISRPTLINRLESGEIPFTKVGTHRRMKLTDVLEYKRKMESGQAERPNVSGKEQKLEALKEMARISMEAGEEF